MGFLRACAREYVNIALCGMVFVKWVGVLIVRNLKGVKSMMNTYDKGPPDA